MPRPRDLGRLRHLVTIQSRSTTQDDAGQPIETWSDHMANVPADVATVAAGESFRGQQVDATATHVVTMRWVDNVTTEMRVNYDPQGSGTGRNLYIVGLRDHESRQRFMDLHCKEGV